MSQDFKNGHRRNSGLWIGYSEHAQRWYVNDPHEQGFTFSSKAKALRFVRKLEKSGASLFSPFAHSLFVNEA